MKYALAAIWLTLVLVLQGHPPGRRIAAYIGSVLLMVHVCALAGGFVYQKVSRDGVPALAGFLGGIAAGIVLGLIAGETVARQPVLFWIVQAVAVLFLAFLPLFRA
ncbi:MAG: hypothetical protein ACKV2U_24795 [Bryobacteraceae bacterium]